MHKHFYGFIVWFVATLYVVYGFCLNTAAGVFFDAIKISLHANSMNVSLASGTFILGFACMQVPAGYLLDRFNARFIVSGGILLLAIGNIIIAHADNLIVFSLANFLQGVGASFAFIAAAVLTTQWFSAKKFPILFGFTQSISCILAGVIHYYFTLTLTTHSWHEIYRGLSVVGSLLFIAAIFLIKSPTHYQRGKSMSIVKSFITVIHNKQITLCALAAALSFGILLAYASFWFMPIQIFYAVNNLDAIIISASIFLGIGVGTPFWGWLSNLVKSRIMIIHVTLALGAMALLLGLYMPHFDNDDLYITNSISFSIGFFLSGSMLFYTMVSEAATDNIRGVAISILNTAVFIFNTIMLFIPYLLITDVSKNFFTYLWILPFCIMFSLLLVYFIKDTYK